MNKIIIIITLFLSTSYILHSQNIEFRNTKLAAKDSVVIPELVQDIEGKVYDYIFRNYPPLALKSGVSGKIILEMDCTENGDVNNVKVVFEKPKDMGFSEVALNASKLLKYKPGKVNDFPVEVKIRQRFTFLTSLEYSFQNYNIKMPTYKMREL